MQTARGQRYPGRPGTTQTLAVGSASVATASAVGASLVRLVSTVNCYLAVGSAPVATSAGMYLPANVPEYFVLNLADLVAVLQVSSAGTLFITPMV